VSQSKFYDLAVKRYGATWRFSKITTLGIGTPQQILAPNPSRVYASFAMGVSGYRWNVGKDQNVVTNFFVHLGMNFGGLGGGTNERAWADYDRAVWGEFVISEFWGVATDGGAGSQIDVIEIYLADRVL